MYVEVGLWQLLMLLCVSLSLRQLDGVTPHEIILFYNCLNSLTELSMT